MAKSAFVETSPIQRIGGKSLKEQQSTIIGGNGAGNVIPNAGPGAGTAVSLFANVKPLPVFEWPITRWWLYSIRVVYITIIKPVITLVKRQFVLSAMARKRAKSKTLEYAE